MNIYYDGNSSYVESFIIKAYCELDYVDYLFTMKSKECNVIFGSDRFSESELAFVSISCTLNVVFEK